MAAIDPEHLKLLRGRRIGPWSRPDVSWSRTWGEGLPKGFYPHAAEIWHRGEGRYQTYVFGPEGTQKGEFFPTLEAAKDFCDERLWVFFPFHLVPPPKTFWDRLDDFLV